MPNPADLTCRSADAKGRDRLLVCCTQLKLHKSFSDAAKCVSVHTIRASIQRKKKEKNIIKTILQELSVAASICTALARKISFTCLV